MLMEKGLVHILVNLFYLHIFFDLIYTISAFFMDYLSLLSSHCQWFGKFDVKHKVEKNTFDDEGNKELMINSRPESSEFDDEFCLQGKDIDMIMQNLGMKHGLEGEEEVEKRWGSNEICEIFEEDELSLEELEECFGVFDQNRDGFIDALELQRVLCVLGFSHGKELDACKNMIRVFDENCDGKIDFNVFVKLMLKSF